MYQKFTDRARKVIQLADLEAQRLNHEYVGTEHILLGLIAAETGVAQVVLRRLGVDPMRLRREIERIVGRGSVVPLGKPPQTPSAKKAIEYAIEEARSLGHDYVGTEHLLLGLMRKTDGVASVALEYQCLSLERVREEVLNILGQRSDRASGIAAIEAPKPPDKPDAATQHLPPHVRDVVKLFDRQIELIQEDKEEFVATQQWEQAAGLRDIQDALKKLRSDVIVTYESADWH